MRIWAAWEVKLQEKIREIKRLWQLCQRSQRHGESGDLQRAASHLDSRGRTREEAAERGAGEPRAFK